MNPWKELTAAAQDSVQADCRRHRERAKLRLAKALLAVRTGAQGNPHAGLLKRLALYAAEFEEDPQAASLVEEARAAGVIPR